MISWCFAGRPFIPKRNLKAGKSCWKNGGHMLPRFADVQVQYKSKTTTFFLYGLGLKLLLALLTDSNLQGLVFPPE